MSHHAFGGAFPNIQPACLLFRVLDDTAVVVDIVTVCMDMYIQMGMNGGDEEEW